MTAPPGVLQPDEAAGRPASRHKRVIVVADMVRSVRLMELCEDSVIDRWRWLVKRLRTVLLDLHDGRLVKSLGDGVLMQCDRVPQAVSLAFDVQRLVGAVNDGIAPMQHLRLRVGIHVGHVVEDDLDVYGTTVNLAARIATAARPGGVAASADVVREAGPQVRMHLEDMGHRMLRHVSKPVHIYALQPAPDVGGKDGTAARRNAAKAWNHVSARFQDQLQSRGVSVTEWVALRTMWAEGDTRHADLIQALGMTKGAASKVISRLEEKGLAQRQLAEGSAREQTLALTRSGRALVPVLADLADANDRHFFGHLGARERQALTGTLRALLRHHEMNDIPIA